MKTNDGGPDGSGFTEGLGGCDEKLRRAVKTVLEGWTLPTDARKILEAAVYATPQPAERVPLTDKDRVPDEFRNAAAAYRAGWNDSIGKPLNAQAQPAEPAGRGSDAAKGCAADKRTKQ